MVDGKFIILVLYVYDLMLTSDENLINSCKEDLAREFNTKDIGLMHYLVCRSRREMESYLWVRGSIPLKYFRDSIFKTKILWKLL